MTAPTAPPPPPAPSMPTRPTPSTTSDEPKWARQLRTLPTDKPWMRWIWVLVGLSFAIPVIAMGSFQLVTLLAHQEETVVKTFGSDGITTLDANVSTGSITVIATNEPTIRVTARVSRGITTTRHSEVIDGDTLRLRANCNHFISKFCSVDYTIEAPPDIFVLARTTHSDISITGTTAGVKARSDGGSMRTTETSGVIDLRTDFGSITAEVVDGSLRAHTAFGSVQATFGQPPDDVLATTDDGSILLIVPDPGGDEGAYAVDLSENSGATSVEVRTDPASPNRIAAHSGNGSVTVRYP